MRNRDGGKKGDFEAVYEEVAVGLCVCAWRALVAIDRAVTLRVGARQAGDAVAGLVMALRDTHASRESKGEHVS